MRKFDNIKKAITKMSILQNLLYKYNVIPARIPDGIRIK